MALDSVAQLVGAMPCRPVGCGFDSRSGHMPRLQVQSPVRVCMRRQPIDVCLSLYLSLSLSLSLSLPLSQKKQ